jgi:hypothetical protein
MTEPNPHNLPIGNNSKPWPRLMYAINNPGGGWVELTKAQAKAFEKDPWASSNGSLIYDIPEPKKPRRPRCTGPT